MIEPWCGARNTTSQNGGKSSLVEGQQDFFSAFYKVTQIAITIGTLSTDDEWDDNDE